MRDFRRIPVMLWWVMLALLVGRVGIAADRTLRTEGGLAHDGARRAHLRLGFVAALLLAAIFAMAAMPAGGGGSGGPPPNPGTRAGTYTLTVTSTDTSGSATLTHNTNLTLTVN